VLSSLALDSVVEKVPEIWRSNMPAFLGCNMGHICNGLGRALNTIRPRLVKPKILLCHRLCIKSLCISMVQGDTCSNCTVSSGLHTPDGQIYSQCTQQIQCVLHLLSQLVPQLDEEVSVCCCKRRNKCIFVHLDCVFGCIHLVVMRLDKLQYTLLFY
jgi:hypothetical protein